MLKEIFTLIHTLLSNLWNFKFKKSKVLQLKSCNCLLMKKILIYKKIIMILFVFINGSYRNIQLLTKISNLVLLLTDKDKYLFEIILVDEELTHSSSYHNLFVFNKYIFLNYISALQHKTMSQRQNERAKQVEQIAIINRTDDAVRGMSYKQIEAEFRTRVIIVYPSTDSPYVSLLSVSLVWNNNHIFLSISYLVFFSYAVYSTILFTN